MTCGKITTNEKELLDYIKFEMVKKSCPPAVREICAAGRLKSDEIFIYR